MGDSAADMPGRFGFSLKELCLLVAVTAIAAAVYRESGASEALLALASALIALGLLRRGWDSARQQAADSTSAGGFSASYHRFARLSLVAIIVFYWLAESFYPWEYKVYNPGGTDAWRIRDLRQSVLVLALIYAFNLSVPPRPSRPTGWRTWCRRIALGVAFALGLGFYGYHSALLHGLALRAVKQHEASLAFYTPPPFDVHPSFVWGALSALALVTLGMAAIGAAARTWTGRIANVFVALCILCDALLLLFLLWVGFVVLPLLSPSFAESLFWQRPQLVLTVLFLVIMMSAGLAYRLSVEVRSAAVSEEQPRRVTYLDSSLVDRFIVVSAVAVSVFSAWRIHSQYSTFTTVGDCVDFLMMGNVLMEACLAFVAVQTWIMAAIRRREATRTETVLQRGKFLCLWVLIALHVALGIVVFAYFSLALVIYVWF